MRYKENKSYQLLKEMASTMTRTMRKILETDDVDAVGDELLRDVLKMYGAGRVFVIYEQKGKLNIIETVADGVEPFPKDFYKTFKWHAIWKNAIENNTYVMIDDVETLGDEYADLRSELLKLKVRSHASVPLKIKQHEIKGVLGIDFMDQTYHWETDDLEWLFNTANTMLMWRQLKLSQEKVKVERANSEDILEKMPIGLISFDIDGNATRINSKALELFGFKDFSVLSNFNIFTSPLLCSQTKDEIRRRPYYDSFFYYHQGYSPESQSNVPPESRTIRIDTRYSKIYDNDGNHRGYLGAYIDRSVETSTDEKVRDLDDIISMTAEVAQIGYARINIMTDVGYATRQWYVNNGMAVNDQYRGLDFFTRALHPDDRHLITDFREAAKRGENPKLQALVRVNEKDGHWDYQKVFSAVTKFDPEHNVVEVSAITQNVTEQIAMEQNLIEAKERAESADKMKTAFLASMSHEIRTPLNSIIGFSRLLCQDDINKKDKGEIVKIVEKNNQMLLQIVSDLLDLSQLEAGSMQFSQDDVDVNKLCNDVAMSTMLKVKQGVKVITHCGKPQLTIKSDLGRLTQVLVNFASNAAKFTSEGHVKIGYFLVGTDTIHFYVEDTGIGIPPEMHSRIFDHFTKVNSFSQGAGIGLEISRAITHHLGGEIGVDSEPGKGSTFWFELKM